MRDELINYVQLECEAEQRDIRAMHLRPVRSRVAKGRCLTGLAYKGVDEDGLFVYSFKQNESQFRAGDLLLINEKALQGKEIEQNGVLVWLEQVDYAGKRILVEKAQDRDPPRTGSCVLDKGFRDYTSEILKQSIHLAYERQDMPALLEGRASICASEESSALVAEQNLPEMLKLTDCQKQAFMSAAVNPVTLIQGPPGSGKSFLLAMIVERAVAEGKSILITAPTNRAIINLLKAIVRRLQPDAATVVNVVGIGKSKKMPSGILQLTPRDRILPKLAGADGALVVGTTVYQAFKMNRAGMPEFDLVVIDEAGQITISEAMPALISGRSYVIAGDHKQLAPVILDPGIHPDHIKRSIFEHLNSHYSYGTITLDVTFRMNESVNEFPSRAFYSNVLRPSKCASERFFAPVRNAGAALDYAITRAGAVTFLELDHNNAKSSAPEEAAVVAELCRDLIVHHSVPPEELAVVSPYRKQNEAIKKRLLALVASGALPLKIKERLTVDTVERIQGQERDVIIFSLCASKRDYTVNNAHFLYRANRLNVAITRSRVRLFLVGSKYFFPHINGVLIDAKNLEVWTDYYEYLDGKGYRVSYC